MPGTLFVVATPIGNLEDVTARALRILRQVALIAAEDTRRTGHLLAHYQISTPTTSLHHHNERAKAPGLISRLEAGADLALVTDAGTPTLSDPGRHLVRLAVDAGIRVEPIPGPSALLAVIAASGVDARTFIFLGFPPTRSRDRNMWFEDVRTANRPVAFFEAPHRIRTTLRQLQATIGDTYVVVGRELTKTHEEFIRGPISSVLKTLQMPRGEFAVVLDIGRSTISAPALAPSSTDIANEFGRIIESGRVSRKEAIRELSRAYQMPPNAIYRAIEEVKKSVK
jgi:16S rRNA (cytidine1402-2'-O)-methyltransferase